jgi:enterobactin synthetase component F
VNTASARREKNQTGLRPLNFRRKNAEEAYVTLQMRTSVARQVLSHAQRVPDHVAVIEPTGQLTYGELADRVCRFASRLKSRGVMPGDRVGIALPRNSEALIAILGAHLCGAAYVPLDTVVPSQRLAAMAETASVSLVVVEDDRHIPEWVGERRCASYYSIATNLPTANFDRDSFADYELTVETHHDALDNLAYVIFTSGSTGQPKGVQITHRNLDALMNAWDQVMGATTHVSLWLSALSFDASVAEIFWPFHHGGTLVIVPAADGPAGLGLSLGSIIRTHSVTHVQCTPTRARMLLAEPDDRSALALIEHFVIGGEALSSTLAGELLDAGVQRLTNAYGPTEATVWATTLDVTRDHLSEAIVAVGAPLCGVTALVVDELGQEVANGSTGELMLGGPFVSAGYASRDDLTAELFGERLHKGKAMRTYRTGDLCALGDDGSLQFHGRADAQVKIRGHRVELGEIEAELMKHELVQHAVVELDRRHVRPDEPARDLIAAVALTGFAYEANRTNEPTRQNDPAIANELRSFLRDRLPEIMVPRAIVTFDALPLTTSGKLDRVAVKAILGGAREQVQTNAPIADLGAMIEDFRAVLPAIAGRVIHEDSNFFDCGGHSLLVVELVERIAKRTDVRVSLSALLRAPTPKLLLNSMLHDSENVYDPIVRFAASRGETETPSRRIYLIHGAGGHVLRFQPVAKALANEVEIIGIQAIGVEGNHTADRTLEQMADRYAAAISAIDPGPYELGGYSDGGTIAVHVADRLQREGKKIRSLIFVDSFRPIPYPTSKVQRIKNAATNLLHRDGLPLHRWTVGAVTGWLRRSDWDAEGVAALKRLGYNDVFSIIEAAIADAPPAPKISAPALLVRTYTENPMRKRDYSIAYEAPAATNVAWISGKHDELFYEPAAQELVAQLRRFFRTH